MSTRRDDRESERESNDKRPHDLRCIFEDAERNHLLDGMRMSAHDKIQSFEGMLDFAWRTGSIKTGHATGVTTNEEL